MAKEEAIEVIAKGPRDVADAMFRVELEDNQHQMLAHISGDAQTFHPHSR